MYKNLTAFRQQARVSVFFIYFLINRNISKRGLLYFNPAIKREVLYKFETRILCNSKGIDILPTLLYETGRDSLKSLIGAFCFIAPASEAEPLFGLMVAPQTDTASPAAFTIDDSILL